MKIENLVYLVSGELKNSPAISYIEGFSNNTEKLKRGDLFFAKDKEKIPEAIKNGAYAILFDGWTQIIDSEIAWIKVKNLEVAALKLLRFFLIQNSTQIYKISKLQQDMIKSIANIDEILFLDDDLIDSLVKLYKKDIKFALINANLIKNISLDIEDLKISKEIKIINRFLFETSFVYNSIFYDRVHIPALFIESFNKILNILDNYNINYQIKNIEKLNHFKPYFIDNNFAIKEFGKSDRVIIFENSYELLEKERDYLEENAKWAKKIYISDIKIDKFLYAKNFDIIAKILYENDFNFALIGTKEINLEKLEIKKDYKKLF